MGSSTFLRLRAFARTGFSDNYSDAEAIRSSPINWLCDVEKFLARLQSSQPAKIVIHT